jgi:hypothetical protein
MTRLIPQVMDDILNRLEKIKAMMQKYMQEE